MASVHAVSALKKSPPQTHSLRHIHILLLLHISALLSLPQRSERAAFQNTAGPFVTCVSKYATRDLNGKTNLKREGRKTAESD